MTREDFTSAENEMLSYVRFPIVLMMLIGRHEIGMRTQCALWMSVSCIAASWYSVEVSILMSLICLAMGILLGWFALRPFRDYENVLAFLREHGLYDMAVYDFSVSVPFLNDRIRLGNECVFGKDYCTILRYTDIRRVYQYVFKLNFVEIHRELHALDTQGKVWRLCDLNPHIDQALAEVLNIMLYKNHRIAVGYYHGVVKNHNFD